MKVSRKVVLGLLSFVAGFLGSAAVALNADEMFEDPEREARAREIGRQLRCVVCKNQSIFDSNAGIARDLRIVVRERMEMGDGDREILDYVAARYGDFVLLNPRISVQTIALWTAPFALLLLGGGALMAFHRNGRRAGGSADLTESDRQEAKRLLGREAGR